MAENEPTPRRVGPGTRWLISALAALMLAGVLAESASAVPQWRQRRWLTRPPIDPTIRPNPQYSSRRYTTTRRYSPRVYYSPYYGRRR